MSAKQILVTGGTGYIGSHTSVELIQAGYEVSIIDNLSNSREEVIDGIEKISGKRPAFTKLDMCDADALSNFFDKNPDIEGVIHFAASKAVGESVQKPLLYYKNNLDSMFNLLECMEKRNIGPLVFSSSCTVYGQPDKLPVCENSPIKKAESPYGHTKQICEDAIENLIASDSCVNTITLRYFNPIGAHPSSHIGELPQGIPNNLVPYITQTATGIREKLNVFGGDWNTRDGTCIRDYIHVVDLAKAHVASIDRLIHKNNEGPLEIFNLGTGTGSTVLEAIQAFEKVNNMKVPYEITDRRAGDIEQNYADTSRANNILGWKAELNLDDMMRDAWNWEQNYRNSLDKAE